MSDYTKMTKTALVAAILAKDVEIQDLQDQLDALHPNQSGPKLSIEKATRIRELFGQGMSKNALSLRYQVSRDSIDAVLTYKIYKVNQAVSAKIEPETKPASKTKVVNKTSDAKIDPDQSRQTSSETRKKAREVANKTN